MTKELEILEASGQEITWKDVLAGERSAAYFQEILRFLQEERKTGKTIYPAKKDIFNAFKLTPFANVKVVIIGQDPYHGPGQAHGLCFSVPRGVPAPPSLQNIIRELCEDIGISIPEHGSLESWAEQGVLLLNAILTVAGAKPGSHQQIGWQRFTDQVIRILSEKRENLIFLLWGSFAQKKCEIIDRKRHTVLTAPHPSPLSAHRGFFGCRHFSKTNEVLASKGIKEIDWQLH